MKRTSILFFASALMLTACKDNRLTISGIVERDVDSLILRVMQYDNSDTLLATVPVVDGKYLWEGTVDSTCIIRIFYGTEPSDFLRVIGEPGNIVQDISDKPADSPSGTPFNDSILAYKNALDPIWKDYDAIYEKVEVAQTDAERDSLLAMLENVWKQIECQRADFLNRHTADILGIYLLRDFQHFTAPERIEEATKALQQNFPGNFWTEFISKRVEGQMRGYPGRQYTDLRMPMPDGSELSLSDIVPNNRYTFVDFWASWCGPCCAEIPNVKAAYEKYHSKGFEVVGVSFDGDAEAWKDAIAKYNMPWPHMSDLQGWSCAAAGVYGIGAIPSTLLIGQDGIIIDRNLRGDQLIKKLDDLYNHD